jgi:ubiquinone/menaquinone biosynthesis C-methylase UbiE
MAVTRHQKEEAMREFWDKKALENAMYYVSSYRPYEEQDAEEFWRWGRTLGERFLEESGIPFTGAETMLEIGSGIGRMTAYFAERFRSVHGMDVSPNMIKQAHENLRDVDNVRLDVGNGYDLHIYGDGQFDFVFSYLTFQHIPDSRITANYIREAGRVLKERGHFYFQVNNLPETLRSRLKLRTRLRRISRALARREDAARPRKASGPSDLDSPAWRGSRMSVPGVERACAEGGMRVVTTEGKGTQYLWIKAIK